MKFPRSCGILLHPASLPSKFGVGDFGPEAFRFVDFLQSAGAKLWQVLPLNPTGYGDSPFQCFSASAGNPLFLSPEKLVERGVLSPSDISNVAEFPEDSVEYGRVIRYKTPLLRKAADNFFAKTSSRDDDSFRQFCTEHSGWLDEFALFMALKGEHDLVAWTKWSRPLALRDPGALGEARKRLARDIDAHKYWQFEFFNQWRELREYAQMRGGRIIGDIPIYVAHDSADVWANRDLFLLDANGNPEKIAGVPPDYFSATGQLWGNPIYD
jgi:4-alpha-glucanotransferase